MMGERERLREYRIELLSRLEKGESADEIGAKLLAAIRPRKDTGYYEYEEHEIPDCRSMTFNQYKQYQEDALSIQEILDLHPDLHKMNLYRWRKKYNLPFKKYNLKKKGSN